MDSLQEIQGVKWFVATKSDGLAKVHQQAESG
jgi:hypothetical protein